MIYYNVRIYYNYSQQPLRGCCLNAFRKFSGISRYMVGSYPQSCESSHLHSCCWFFLLQIYVSTIETLAGFLTVFSCKWGVKKQNINLRPIPLSMPLEVLSISKNRIASASDGIDGGTDCNFIFFSLILGEIIR